MGFTLKQELHLEKCELEALKFAIEDVANLYENCSGDYDDPLKTYHYGVLLSGLLPKVNKLLAFAEDFERQRQRRTSKCGAFQLPAVKRISKVKVRVKVRERCTP